MSVYEECLSATSCEDALWYVIAADDKQNARLIVSRIVIELFEGMAMSYPKSSSSRIAELREIRRELTA
jgi:hypothetical protein